MKKLFVLSLALIMCVASLISCTEGTETISSETPSVESVVSEDTSSVESVTSEDTSSVESTASQDTSSIESTASQDTSDDDTNPQAGTLSVSRVPVDISIDEALSRYHSIVINGDLFFLQADNEGKDVNIRLMNYDCESDSIKNFLSFKVKNGQAYDTETSEPASSRCNTYKSVAGNTVFTSSNFDFKLYIDMNNKRVYIYDRNKPLPRLPISIDYDIYASDYSLVEYSPTAELSVSQAFESLPEYGEIAGRPDILADAYVARYIKDSNHTICLYNYNTKKLASLCCGDIFLSYDITEDEKYIIFTDEMKKDVYCCDIQTGEVKPLPVTDRPLDNRTDEGEEVYFILDLNVFSDGEKLYWEDYDKSTNRKTLCCFDFDKGTNVKLHKHPEYEWVTYYLLTDKGVYFQSEIPWGITHHTSFEKDVFFFDGEKLWTVAENVIDFHLLENENVMYVQKEAENKFLFEKIDLSDILS